MPMHNAWQCVSKRRLEKWTRNGSFHSTCLLGISFGLIFCFSNSEIHADSPGGVTTSDYNVETTVQDDQNEQPELEQTQFSLRRKKKPKPVEKDPNDFSQYVRVLSKGTSKRSSRKEGLAELPLNQLNQEKKAKAYTVLNKISMYRELPTISLDVNHDVYRYFLQNPEIAVAIWRVMGISKFQMWQNDTESYGADAGDGSKGNVDVLYRSPNECLIVCDGVYDSPLLVKPIAAKALMYLQAEYKTDQNHNQYVTHKMTLFISFPSQTIGTAARIVSPVSNMIIDKNFHEVSLFLHMMTRSMAEHPQWVEQLAERLDGVLDIRKQQLLQLTSKVYQENKKLQMIQNRQQVTPVAGRRPSRVQ